MTAQYKLYAEILPSLSRHFGRDAERAMTRSLRSIGDMKVKLVPDTRGFARDAERGVTAALRSIGEQRVKVSADTSGFARDARNEIDRALRGVGLQLKIGLDVTHLAREATRAVNAINSSGILPPLILNVDVDVSSARRAGDLASRIANRAAGPIRLDVDFSMFRGLGSLFSGVSSGIRGIGAALSILGTLGSAAADVLAALVTGFRILINIGEAVSRAIQAIASQIAGASAAVGGMGAAIGEALASAGLTLVLLALAAAFLAVGAAAFVAIGAMALAAAGFATVTAAVIAFIVSAVIAGAVMSTLVIVAGALGGVLASLGGALTGLAGGFGVLLLAIMPLIEVLQDFVSGENKAADAARQGARAISAAQRQELDAQQALNDARKDAIRYSEDLSDSVRGLANSEESARISLERARESQKNLLVDQKKTRPVNPREEKDQALDRREAALNVSQAEERLRMTLVESSRTRKEYNKLQKTGLDGTAPVIAAKKRLAEAQRGVNQAQQDAAISTAKANSSLAKLTSTGLAFVNTLKPFIKFVTGPLVQAAQSTLFPGLTDFLNNMKPLLPIILKITKILGSGMADFFRSLGTLFSGSGANGFFGFLTTLASAGAKFMRYLGGSLGAGLVSLIKGLAAAADKSGPTMKVFAEGIGEMFSALGHFFRLFQGKAASGTAAGLKGIFDIFNGFMKGTGRLIVGLMQRAGPAINRLSKPLLSIANSVVDMFLIFADSGIIDAFGDLLTHLAKVFSDPVVRKSIQDLGVEFSKVLRELGPTLVAVVKQIAPLLPDLIKFFGNLSVKFLKIFTPLAELIGMIFSGEKIDKAKFEAVIQSLSNAILAYVIPIVDKFIGFLDLLLRGKAAERLIVAMVKLFTSLMERLAPYVSVIVSALVPIFVLVLQAMMASAPLILAMTNFGAKMVLKVLLAMTQGFEKSAMDSGFKALFRMLHTGGTIFIKMINVVGELGFAMARALIDKFTGVDIGGKFGNFIKNGFVKVADGITGVINDKVIGNLNKAIGLLNSGPMKWAGISIPTVGMIPKMGDSVLGSAGNPLKKRAGAMGLASGGHVRGPGGPTSDSIEARLSNGEYVVRAKAVQALGVPTLDRLNKADKVPAFRNGGSVDEIKRVMAGSGIKGVSVNSTYRNEPGSYHGSGEAVDFGGNGKASVRDEVAGWWSQNWGPKLLELIHSKTTTPPYPGWYIKNGKKVGPYGPASAHENHVHVAARAGFSQEKGALGSIGDYFSGAIDKASSFAGRSASQVASAALGVAKPFIGAAKNSGNPLVQFGGGALQKLVDAIPRKLEGMLSTNLSGGSEDGTTAGSGSTMQTAYARAKALGASNKVLLSLFETGLVESGMRNLASRAVPESMRFPNEGTAAGDHDSVGFLQQRAGWGSVASRMNVAESSDRYLRKAMARESRYSTAGRLAQAVQVSAYPDRYDGARGAAVSALKKIDPNLSFGTYDQGGPLKPGHTLAYNGLGKNEWIGPANDRGNGPAETRLDEWSLTRLAQILSNRPADLRVDGEILARKTSNAFGADLDIPGV